MSRKTYAYALFGGRGGLCLLWTAALLLFSVVLAAQTGVVTAAPDSTKPAFDPVPYDEPPQALSPIIPSYPAKCVKAGVQGTVVLELGITKEGFVETVTVRRSVDNSAGGLDEAAIEAAHKLKFKPGKVNGKPVDSLVILPVQFKLN